jgi:hypothetical protein
MPAMDFAALADDFFVNINLQTALALPGSRETVLQFCEAVQREFNEMTSFYQRPGGEYVLEGDHESGSYAWMEMQENRLSAGYFNPPGLEAAYRLHRWLLERCVYFLGVSPIDVECLDVLYGFNLDFLGNRDEILSTALLSGSALGSVFQDTDARPLECEPSIVFALDGGCSLQARLSLESRSSSYQVRTGQYSEDPISVYFTVRQYPSPGQVFDLQEAFRRQSGLCEDLTIRNVIPSVIQPICEAIAAAS